MRSVYSVGQVNSYIKNMFTQDFMLGRIYVRGEVSNCKYHTSGHIYFSLKDETGTIACVMFAGQRGGLAFQMREGQQVIVLGSVNVYERDGRYQLYAKEIILDGAGLLYEKFEKLKQELEEMGMFAEEYKRPIPAFAGRIGIVTAPTGAAIRDIIHIASRRNPYVQLYLCPALVQGSGAAESIAEGIRRLDAFGVDVIIAGRGGGSIEDLWAFNEETVARAIFACETPVISAVGHETDTTIADYVADLRAPTPSAAAELAVYEYSTVRSYMEEADRKLRHMLLRTVEEKQRQTDLIAQKLSYLHPQIKLNERRQQAADLEERLRQKMQEQLREAKHAMSVCAERLNGLSPVRKLGQGFSYVENADGKNIRRTKEVCPGEVLSIRVTDGTIHAQVTGVEKEAEDGRKYSEGE
nr:exodeoxyribonuclease VII large subunit [uncultured Faecalimonas sp.]